MKICFVRHAYFPDDPRDRKQAYALVAAGHSVDVICLRKNGQSAFEKVGGVRVVRIPLKHKRAGIFRYFTEYALSFFLTAGVLLFLFLCNRYACIQVSTMPDFLIFTTIIPKLLGSKVLLDLHEPTPELWKTKYGKRLRMLLLLQVKIEQLAIRYADRCITVTETIRYRFSERGAEMGKITVIPNVCEEAFEEAFSQATLARHDSRNSILRLVTHGLIEERYGHDMVVEALEYLRDDLPDIHYYIFGDGEYKTKLEKFVQNFTCRDRVHLMGFLLFPDLLHGLLNADVGVIAMKRSPYSELIDTNKMYEYIALHKPVITSRLPAVEENFDDSCLMYFEPGDFKDLARCIRELYHNPPKRILLAENAHRRYEKMRWGTTKKTYVRVIEELVFLQRKKKKKITQ